jgi:cytoskeletal protein CcmA (bactofilin family)
MFNKDSKEVNFKEAETIIGPSVKVKGNFHGEGNMIIDGLVEGSIKTSKNLLIGNKAKINAGVEAAEARVGGEVAGNIKVQGYLEITSSAKIDGDIEANELSIERGAKINGRFNMGSGKKPNEPVKTA